MTLPLNFEHTSGVGWWLGDPDHADGRRGTLGLCLALMAIVAHDFVLITGWCKGAEAEIVPHPTVAAVTASSIGRTEVPTALIVILTAPDFYHGALLSTFMPYLLAKEGPRMAGSASVFMGCLVAFLR